MVIYENLSRFKFYFCCADLRSGTIILGLLELVGAVWLWINFSKKCVELINPIGDYFGKEEEPLKYIEDYVGNYPPNFDLSIIGDYILKLCFV